MSGECIFCEVDIHGSCQLNDCDCPCKKDRDYFMKDFIMEERIEPHPEATFST